MPTNWYLRCLKDNQLESSTAVMFRLLNYCMHVPSGGVAAGTGPGGFVRSFFVQYRLILNVLYLLATQT